MKIAVNITNHNQNNLVDKAIESLNKQSVKPEMIFVTSDDTPYSSSQYNVSCINHNQKGRCYNRNIVLLPFSRSGCEAIIFMDGDCYLEDPDFIKKYIKHFKKHDLVFGTRKHTDITGLEKPASDLLTANMDELWSDKPLNYTDLRVVTGAVEGWKKSKDFYERLDLMITGMIGWSCNFGFTFNGLLKHADFMKRYYGIFDIFDTKAFSGSWGYEDVAMGIDALFAGLDIWIDDDIEVIHNSHNRTDALFDHVRGRHIIMTRMRELEDKLKIKNFKYNWLYKLKKIFGDL